MRPVLYACALFFYISSGEPALAQTDAPVETSADRNTIPLARLITDVASRTSKKFVVDPKVQAQVSLAGQNASAVTYSDLLQILKVHGFTAVETGGYVSVVPEAGVRYMAIPIITGNEKYPDAQYVTKTISVRTMPAALLVPILRPMLPQQGHLAAMTCANSLIMVDTFDNVRRIETLVKNLDTGEPYKVPKCEVPAPQPPAAPAAQRSSAQGAS